jgi:hypothetical protein
MTDTKTRAARVARTYGMVLDARLFVPVDKKDLNAQVRVSQTVAEALETGNVSAVMALPGARVLSTNGRYDAVRLDAAPSVEVEPAPAGDDAQTDIEDAISEEQAGDEEAATGRRGGRRQAA